MKQSIIIIITIAAFMALSVPSQAMYNPKTGRFLQQDPLGIKPNPQKPNQFNVQKQYSDGMNLYQYTKGNPIKYLDWSGLECDYCGPDVTGFFIDLVLYALDWRDDQGKISRNQSSKWLEKNGMNLDWFSTGGPYKNKKCPSGVKCRNTYWLCGECVHDRWIGNFMYGFLGRLLHMPDFLMDKAGNIAQSPYEDPPWDTAGYGLARLMFDELVNPKGKIDICTILKSNTKLWDTANNTSVSPPVSGIDLYVYWIDTTPKWPKPLASSNLYKKCKKCPEALPSNIQNLVPGGKFPKGFPDIK